MLIIYFALFINFFSKSVISIFSSNDFLMTTIDTLKKFSQETSRINKLYAALTTVFISLIFFQDEGDSTFEFFK